MSAHTVPVLLYTAVPEALTITAQSTHLHISTSGLVALWCSIENETSLMEILSRMLPFFLEQYIGFKNINSKSIQSAANIDYMGFSVDFNFKFKSASDNYFGN